MNANETPAQTGIRARYRATVRIDDTDRLEAWATAQGLETGAIERALCNPPEPAREAGYEILSTIVDPVAHEADTWTITVEARIDDPLALKACAKAAAMAAYGEAPDLEDAAEALVEHALSANATPSLAEIGLSLLTVSHEILSPEQTAEERERADVAALVAAVRSLLVKTEIHPGAESLSIAELVPLLEQVWEEFDNLADKIRHYHENF